MRIHHTQPPEAMRQAPEGVAPPFPSERHLVSAALAAERIRGLSERMLLLLQHCPQDAATFRQLSDAVFGENCNALVSYEAFEAVNSCEGQA